jgi:hypothetical protein
MVNSQLTPFQRHKQRVMEKQNQERQQQELETGTGDAAQNSVENHGAFESLKMTLEQDLTTLSGLSRGDEKTAKLKALLNVYLPHVNAYVEKGDVFANPIAVQVLIWLFDLGAISKAVELSKVLIEQNQVMPSQFTRKLVVFVYDQILDWSGGQFKQKNSPQPYFEGALKQVDGVNVPDVVKAKYHKLAGELLFDTEKWEGAITEFEAALSFDSSVGVKTQLNQARAKFK